MTSGMNNLTTLIKRLEAATSRLEDIASSTIGSEQGDVGLTASKGISSTASDPELPGLAKSTPPVSTPAAPSLPPTVKELDDIIHQELEKLVTSSKSLDGTISDQTTAVAQAFKAQRQYILMTTKAKKPDMTAKPFQELISGLQHEMGSVNDIRDSNRQSTYKDHLAMIAEGVGALQWIVIDSKPADYIGEVLGGAQLYGNRVLKEYKEKDQTHVTFVQSYYALWKALQAYVRKNYLGGVTWNLSGVDLSEALKEPSAPTVNGTSAPAPAAGGPPPPPPPPLPKFDAIPPPPPQPASSSGAASGGDMGAIFDQLNKGESVTAGLRKVDKSQMTHKNPSLRASSVVPDRKGSEDSLGRSRSRGPETKPKPDSMKAKSGAALKKPAKHELDGNKWIIENYDEPSEPLKIEVSLTQSILISRCNKTTIQLVGKANAISIDNCSRTNLIIDNLVSSVDAVKCPNFALQVTGSLPTVMLDQVDGAAIYLSKESMNTEIYTSKCTSVNINMPPAKEEDDYKEVPLPEQIRTYVKDGQLVSEIVEHSG